jgi:putative membrane protein
MTFTLHMAWHMALVVIIAPVVAWIISRPPLDPVRTAPALFPPLIACLVEFLVVWGWHIPALHDAARHNVAMLAAEQVSFTVAAMWLWLSIIGGGDGEHRARAATGVIALVLTFAHMTMLGALIALAPRVLYVHHAITLADQQLGGAVMLAAGAVAYPLASLWIVRSLVNPEPTLGTSGTQRTSGTSGTSGTLA